MKQHRAHVASHGKGAWITRPPAGTKKRVRSSVVWCGTRPNNGPLAEPLPRVWPAASVQFVAGAKGTVEHVLTCGAANDTALSLLVGSLHEAVSEVGRSSDEVPVRLSLALLEGKSAVPSNMLATAFEEGMVSQHATKPEEWSIRYGPHMSRLHWWIDVRNAHWDYVRTGLAMSTPLRDRISKAYAADRMEDPFHSIVTDGIPIGVKVTSERTLAAARTLHGTHREALSLPFPEAWNKITDTKFAMVVTEALFPAPVCAWCKYAHHVWPGEGTVGLVSFVRGVPVPGAVHASEVDAEWVRMRGIIIVLNCEAADSALTNILTSAAALLNRPTVLLVGSDRMSSPAARMGSLPRSFFADVLVTEMPSAVVMSDRNISETCMPVMRVVEGTSMPRPVNVGSALSVGSGILAGLGPAAAAAVASGESRGGILRLSYTTVDVLVSTYTALRRVVGPHHVAVAFLKQPEERVKEFTDKVSPACFCDICLRALQIEASSSTRLWLDVALGDTLHIERGERVYTSGSPAGVRGNFLALVPGVVFTELPPLRVRALMVVACDTLEQWQLQRAAALASHNLVVYLT